MDRIAQGESLLSPELPVSFHFIPACMLAVWSPVCDLLGGLIAGWAERPAWWTSQRTT